MSAPVFLAKSNGETLQEHTERLLTLYRRFCEQYKSRYDPALLKLLELACKFHDYGKLNSAFQNKIYHAAKREVPEQFRDVSCYQAYQHNEIPHGILSCLFIDYGELAKQGYTDEQIRILISAVFTHHARSYDYPIYQNERGEAVSVSTEVLEDMRRNAELCGLEQKVFTRSVKKNLIASKVNTTPISYSWWLNFLFVKGMLNWLDYSASSGLKDDELQCFPDNAAARTTAYLCAMGYQRNDCQRYLQENAEENVILTASTGIGKTEAAMLWAGESEAFYTLPYKVSINAMYRRIGEAGYYSKEKTAVLHSDALTVLLEESKEETAVPHSDASESLRKLESVKLFSYPMTVCTVDQLFPFVFRALGTELTAAILSHRKVIIDEIQSYSPELLAEILYGIKVVHDLGGKFLIMTATLPPHIKQYFEKNNIPCKVSEPFFSGEIRHRIRLAADGLDFEEIARRSETEKVLVLCNTVAGAQQAYRTLDKYGANARLLHARFIGRDRSRLEEEIQNFAKSGQTGVWVSTQLVEASLDIDFDALYTEMSTADSLLQRMGRCYRKRVRTLPDANIIVAYTKSGCGKVYDKDILNRSWQYLQKFDGAVMTEWDKQNYMEQVYCKDEIVKTDYYKKFVKKLESLGSLSVAKLKKTDAEARFRDIQSVTVVPCCFERKVEELARQMGASKGKEKLELRQEIRSYSVSVRRGNGGFDFRQPSGSIDFPICLNDYDETLGLLARRDEDGNGKFV